MESIEHVRSIRFPNRKSMKMSVKKLAVFLFVCFGWLTPLTAVADPQKIAIFYSSMGNGHKGAADAIEAEIKVKSPEAIVQQVNVRDFMNPRWEKIDRRLYWAMFKHSAYLIDRFFESFIKNGTNTVDFSKFMNGRDYNTVEIAKWLKEFKPDTTIATHYGSAIVLANAREQAGIKTRLVWVFTDYLEHFFPRISQRTDMTYVPHSSQIEYWKSWGVDADKVDTSLMPLVLPKADDSAKPVEPGTLVVTMQGGLEGLKDNVKVIKSIVQNNPGRKMVINAFVGKQESEYKRVQDYVKTIPSNVEVRLFGFVPRGQVIAHIMQADVYVVKGGGLSPMEGSVLNKPTILVDEFGSHEREHSKFFAKNGLAERTMDSNEVGKLIGTLLADKEKLERMSANQKEFSQAVGLDKIVEAALTPFDPNAKAEIELIPMGKFQGREVNGQAQSLEKLNRDYPSNFEILLGYPVSKSGRYLDMGGKSNPFGHIGIRIEDKVYTVNHRSKIGEGQLHEISSLAQYLYSTQARPEIFEGYDFVGVHGQAYGRETISLRMNLPAEDLRKMLTELDLIEQEFKQKKTGYDVKACNCSTLIDRVLEKGNLIESRQKGIAFPIDVFESALSRIKDREIKTTTIRYAQIKGAQSGYVSTDVPLTFKRLFRSVARIMKNMVAPNSLFYPSKPEAQVEYSPGRDTLYYENFNRKELGKSCLWFYTKK